MKYQLKKIYILISKDFSEIIYLLIYPAILGSMIYDIAKFDDNLSWRKVSISLFYLLDYFHLYYIMKKKFADIKRRKPSYIIGDLVVSFSLLFSFNSANPKRALIAFLVISCCFLWYSSRLKYNLSFYIIFLVLSLTSCLFTYFGFINVNTDIFSIFITTLYACYVVVQAKKAYNTQISSH